MNINIPLNLEKFLGFFKNLIELKYQYLNRVQFNQSSNDFDSKNLKSLEVEKTSNEIPKYSKENIYLTNLRELSLQQIDKLKTLYERYNLIDHIKTPSVNYILCFNFKENLFEKKMAFRFLF